jgi:hypothetical protein
VYSPPVGCTVTWHTQQKDCTLVSQAAEHSQPAPEDPVHMRLAIVFSHCSSYQAKAMLQFCQAAQLTANAAFPNTSHADAKLPSCAPQTSDLQYCLNTAHLANGAPDPARQQPLPEPAAHTHPHEIKFQGLRGNAQAQLGAGVAGDSRRGVEARLLGYETQGQGLSATPSAATPTLDFDKPRLQYF